MKKKVVLFRGNSYTNKSQKVIWTPTELISLAVVFEPYYEPIIIDGNVVDEETSFKSIKNELDDIVCVGISAKTGIEIKSGLIFASLIKKYKKDIPVVWGGWHVSCLPEQSIENPLVDAVVIGLGQKIFLEILNCITSNISYNHFANVVTKDNVRKFNPQLEPRIDFSDIPLPDYELLNLEYYRKESTAVLPYPKISGLKLTGYLQYVTSFGCPYACKFCCNDRVFHHRWFGYSVDKVITHLETLVKKGFNCIMIADPEFFFNTDRVEKFCDLIIERKMCFVWDAQITVRSLLKLKKHNLLEKIKRAGCWRFNIGAESGSETMLHYMNKKQSADEILECARILKDTGITGCFNLLFGLPDETMKDVFQTFELAYQIKKINADSPMPVSFYTPFPATPLFEEAVKKGFKQPKNLEEWGNYKTSYIEQADNLPWRDKRKERLVYDVLTFYLPIAVPGNIKRGTIKMFKNKLQTSYFKGFLKIMSNLADYRMRKQKFGFRIEVWFFNVISLIIRKPKYMSGKIED